MQTLNHHVGYSRENEFWFVRFYPYKTEQQAKDAVSTFTGPAAPVECYPRDTNSVEYHETRNVADKTIEGLETIGYIHRGTAGLLMEGAVSKAVIVQKPGGDFNHPVVFAEQAEAIIAAKDKRISELEELLRISESCNHFADNLSKEMKTFETDNATLTARVKELAEALDKQRELDNESTLHHYNRAKALETQLAAARKALEPFANVAEHDIGNDEDDGDIFWPMSNARYSMAGRLRVGDLRRARAALEDKP